jgi:hypothetical protein
MMGAMVLIAGLPSLGQAQTERAHVGPRASYQFELEEIGVGGQFGAAIGRYLEFYPSFDLFLADGATYWNLNADFKYRLQSPSVRWIYLGTGLNVAHRSINEFKDTGAGLNLFAGIESLTGRVHPFAEFRFAANDGESVQLAAGLNFTLRR